MGYCSLRGLPPACVFRLAASCRKYSLPRFAVVLPPLCPMIAAGVIFACPPRSSARANAARSSSRHRGVRFSGRGSVVLMRRSISDKIFLRASMLLRSGILSSWGQSGAKSKRSLLRFQRTFQTLPSELKCDVGNAELLGRRFFRESGKRRGAPAGWLRTLPFARWRRRWIRR